MTEEEQRDIETLKAKQRSLKITCFDYLIALSRMTEKELKSSGHVHGRQQAIVDTVLSTKKNLDRLLAEHLQRYPD